MDDRYECLTHLMDTLTECVSKAKENMEEVEKRRKFIKTRSSMSNANWIKQATRTRYNFRWLPKRCSSTNKLLWLKNAYVVEHVFNSRSSKNQYIGHRWYTKEEYTKFKLKE